MKALPFGYLLTAEEIVVVNRMFIFLEDFPFDLQDVFGGPELIADANALKGAVEVTVLDGDLDGLSGKDCPVA